MISYHFRGRICALLRKKVDSPRKPEGRLTRQSDRFTPPSGSSPMPVRITPAGTNAVVNEGLNPSPSMQERPECRESLPARDLQEMLLQVDHLIAQLRRGLEIQLGRCLSHLFFDLCDELRQLLL